MSFFTILIQLVVTFPSIYNEKNLLLLAQIEDASHKVGIPGVDSSKSNEASEPSKSSKSSSESFSETSSVSITESSRASSE